MMDAGIYPGMSGAEYAAQTQWVTATRLKRSLPDYYKPPTGDRSNLDFGVAFHTTVLGTGEPIWPVAASTWAGKDAKEQRLSAYDAGHVPLLDKELPKIEAMAESILTHPIAREYLGGQGQSELSVFAEVDEIPCKARFDRLVDNIGVDVKTTTIRPHPEAIARSVIEWGYEVQADHYLRVAQAAEMDVTRFVLIFCSKEPPHPVMVVELDESFYERAAVLREIALDRIMHAEMVPAYPGAEKALTVELPRWARLSR